MSPAKSQQCEPCSSERPPDPGGSGFPDSGRYAPPESRGGFQQSHHRARPAGEGENKHLNTTPSSWKIRDPDRGWQNAQEIRSTNGKENSSPQSATVSRSGSSGQGSDGVGRMHPVVPGQNQWPHPCDSLNVPCP